MSLFKVSTRLGEISIGINNNHNIYFLNEKIVVNGVDYHASGHMGFVDGKWKMLDSFSIRKVNSVKHDDYSRSAWQKADEVLTVAIAEWLGKSENAIHLQWAHEKYNQERRERLLEQIAEKQKEIDALNAEIAALI
jgi:hypothetical protein